MPVLTFGLWEPDKLALDAVGGPNSAPLVALAENVLPGANSWKPCPSLSEISTHALPEACRGLSMARRLGGTWDIFAGTATGLYRYSATGWITCTRSVGGPYTLAAGEAWKFAQFGTFLIAVQGNDSPQVIDIDVNPATNKFADLAGSPPRAKSVAVVGDFVVLGPLASNSRKLQWSGINDHTSWTIGTNLSDEQELPDGGAITGIVGRENGAVILQEFKIRSMGFQPGSDYVFSFDTTLEDQRGAVGLSAWAVRGSDIFFWAEDGLCVLGQTGVVQIGKNRVDAYVRNHVPANLLGQVLCVADPVNARILWALPNSSAGGPTSYSAVIGFDYSLNRWFMFRESADWWGSLASAGATLESLSFDLEEGRAYSFDSAAYAGGRPLLAAISMNHRLAFAEGKALSATLKTVEAHLVPGQRAYVSEAYPIGDFTGSAGTEVLWVSTRENLRAARSTSLPKYLERTGKFSLHSSGRTHQFMMQIPAGATWQHVSSLAVEAQPDGDS